MNTTFDFAPVVIPTLNRFQHLKKCLESLERCKYSSQTDVIICLDYPSKDEHKDGYNQINHYLNEKKFEFKNTYILRRERNFGLTQNVTSAYDSIIFRNYKFWILSEDDNQFSYNFLEYMNIQLNKYYHDDSVYAVNGYSFPIDIDFNLLANYSYFSHAYSPWGTGFWVHKYQATSSEEADSYLLNFTHAITLLKSAPYVFEMLVSMRYSNKYYGDTIYRSRFILNNTKCVSPVLSKVRNCGFDNSGINCIDDGGFHAKQIIDTSDTFKDEGLISETDIEIKICNFLKPSFNRMLKAIIKYFIYYFKHCVTSKSYL